jgi:hypothetical protein
MSVRVAGAASGGATKTDAAGVSAASNSLLILAKVIKGRPSPMRDR